MYFWHLRRHIWLSYSGPITFVERRKGAMVWWNVTANQNPSSSPLQQNPDTNLSACPFSMLCAFMCQLINFAETLVQLGSFPLLPGVSPAPLDLCAADRSPRCSSAQKTACVCTFFPSLPFILCRSLTAATWASTYTVAAQVAVRLQSPGSRVACLTDCGGRGRQNLAALSCWRAMKTSVAWEQSNFQSHANMQATLTSIAEEAWRRRGYFSKAALPKEARLELVLFWKPLLRDAVQLKFSSTS